MPKDELKEIEIFLNDCYDDDSAWIFGTRKAEKKLVHELVSAIQNKIRFDANEKIIAPNIFLLNVSSNQIEDIRARQYLIDTLEKNLTDAANISNVKFSGPININIFPDGNLKENNFKIFAIWKDEDAPDSTKKTLQEQTPSEVALAAITPKAFLIVEGTKIFTLDQDIINIGRSIENHLVLDDIRISRSHAQIRVIKGRHMLFDLESSGGTFINNKRITQVTLHPGDVISLAGIPLVYGQDAFSFIDKTNEYIRPTDVSDDSTTTVKIIRSDSDK